MSVNQSDSNIENNKLPESKEKKVIIDMKLFKDLTMGDHDFEKDLLMVFRESAIKNVEKMENALKNGNEQAWCVSCHSFKGGANAIGAVELAKALEHGQKNPKETDQQKRELIEKVRREYETSIKFLSGEIERSLMFY